MDKVNKLKKWFIALFSQKKKHSARYMVLEIDGDKYFHEDKVRAMLNAINGCSIEDASTVISQLAKAEKIKLNG